MKAALGGRLLAAAVALILIVPILARPATAEPPVDTAPKATPGGMAGVSAWRRGDYAAAIAAWQPLADGGNADAQFNLAQAYRLGRGVPADEGMAQGWYRRAADQGHMQAQANYGLLLYQNGDQRGAMPWLEKAADQGDARAQYVVGTALFNGDPLPRDWVRAYVLMSRAAGSGLPSAVSSLAEMNRYIPAGQRQQARALLSAPKTPVQLATATATATAATPAKPESRPARAKPMAPAPAANGRWRIQLGAFSDSARAEGLWRRIQASAPALASAQPFLVKAGPVTRLQAGPFVSRAAADQACAAIRTGSQACFSAMAD